MQTRDVRGSSKKATNKTQLKKQKYAPHRSVIIIGISTLTKATIIFFCCPDVAKEYSCVRAAVPEKGSAGPSHLSFILPLILPQPAREALLVKPKRDY